MSPWRSNGGSSGNGTGDANGNGNRNYIEHRVSRFDTLAGVAIKYGVEVADIKRLNNLATDLQMFALRSLHIPLPGRHPPSPVLPDCSTNSGGKSSAKTLPRIGNANMLELRSKSPQLEISSAMDTLQKYYGLKSPFPKDEAEAEELEMSVYSNGTSDYFDDRLLPRALPTSDLFSSRHQKSRNLIGDFLLEMGETVKDTCLEETGDVEGERSNEKRVRRRQKSEVDHSKADAPERLLKEDNNSGSSDFSPITGKGLALRPKSASRTTLEADAESGRSRPILVGPGDSTLTDGFSGVRKSSSMPCLPDEDNSSSSSSAWPTPLWSLKADLQVLSAASITRPIFDGLPKPITGRRNKAALD